MDDTKRTQAEDLMELSTRFTALNNELLNTKRELVKRNIELDKLQHELQEKNHALTGINEELEKRVSERTKQLTLALDEIDDFAYSLSHDLRTPLRGIDGFSSVLMEDYGQILDEQAIEHLKNIRRDAKQLGEVLDALHGLTKVTRRKLVRSEVNLSDLGERVMQNLIRLHQKQEFEYHIQKGLSENCDKELMAIALTHLFSNGIKFSKYTQKARIEFGMIEQNGTKTYYVKDNGIGLNMDYVGKLFQNFQRLHRKSEFSGIGIGLATVRRVVLKHGGSIRVESEPEAGAQFIFTLAPGDIYTAG